MNTALIYNGSPIGERDEMLCLTDMWRAAGAGPRPADWARKEGAKFIDYIGRNLNVPKEHIWISERGRHGGSTWAHWQIAIAYAQDLSPEFHAWCNEVVRAHMERRNLPVQAVQGAITISEEQLGRFAERVGAGAIRAAHDFIQQNVDPRFDRVENLIAANHQAVEARFKVIEEGQKKGKAQPHKATLAQHNWVNFQLGGRCPCCQENMVCNPDGSRTSDSHFDHFTEVDKPIPENSWIVCADCNLKKLPKQRSECRSAFDAYQKRRRDRAERESTPLLFWRRAAN